MLTRMTNPPRAAWLKWAIRNSPTIVCMLFLLIGIPVRLWHLRQTRERAWRHNDGLHLRTLGSALKAFAADHNGCLADDLGELYQGKYCDAAGIFVSPGSATKPPANAAELRAGQCDYVYLGAGLAVGLRAISDGIAREAHPRTVIAHTKPEIHGLWMNVLFPDGHTVCVNAKGIGEAVARNGWQLAPPKPPGYQTPLVLRYGKLEQGRLTVDLASVGEVSDAQLATLRESPALRVLRLPGNRIADSGLAIIAEISGLEELDLSGSPVTDASLLRLACLPHLQVLRLYGSRFTSNGLKQLAAMSSLTGLDIGGTGVGNSDLKLILPLTGLTELGLSNTAITDEGVPLLVNFRALRRLDLARTAAGDAGLIALWRSRSLRSLDLTGTRVGDPGMPWLAGLAELEVLCLSDTRVTDRGIKSLRNLKALEAIWLSGTEVTDASIDVLKGFDHLKRVHLGHTRTTEAGQSRLRAALPGAEITGEPPAQ